MLGHTNVGKTSLVLRFAEGYYRENSRSPTLGAFFITKRLQTESGITCKVQIWDTAGQQQFRKMAPMYYKTAAAAVLCYDVSDVNSFDCVKDWLEELSPIIQGAYRRIFEFSLFHFEIHVIGTYEKGVTCVSIPNLKRL